VNGSNGSDPELQTEGQRLQCYVFDIASITFCEHFWVATFSAGAQRPSSWVKKPCFESGAKN
jgi:hypothetical protein